MFHSYCIVYCGLMEYIYNIMIYVCIYIYILLSCGCYKCQGIIKRIQIGPLELVRYVVYQVIWCPFISYMFIHIYIYITITLYIYTVSIWLNSHDFPMALVSVRTTPLSLAVAQRQAPRARDTAKIQLKRLSNKYPRIY